MLICKRKCRPDIPRHCAAEAQRLSSGAGIGRAVLKAAEKQQAVTCQKRPACIKKYKEAAGILPRLPASRYNVFGLRAKKHSFDMH